MLTLRYYYVVFFCVMLEYGKLRYVMLRYIMLYVYFLSCSLFCLYKGVRYK